MRYLIPLIALLLFAGCDFRDNMSAVPDRQGHAAGEPLDTSAPPRGFEPTAPVSAGERTHVVTAGESLYQISQRYGVSMKSIIRRNNLEGLPSAGMTLIIPPR